MDVKSLCLGVLTLGDASGYEIRKMFEDGPFGHFYDASYGSIYPALGKLLADGQVSVTEHSQSGRPSKKVYSLTPTGRAAFRTALAEPPGADRLRSEVLVRLFFAEMMNPADLRVVYDSYLAHFRGLAGHLNAFDPTGIPPGRMLVRGLGQTFYEGMASYLEQHREAFLQQISSVTEAAK